MVEDTGLYYTFYASDGNMRLYFGCPDQCSSCSFPNNCSACAPGFTLNGVTCLANPPSPTSNNNNYTHCVNNKFQVGNICVEYCHKKCKTCNSTRTDCIECS